MAIGDVTDIVTRLRGNMPPWFPDQGQSPIIDGVLTGIASIYSYVYAFIQYARGQSRVRTSSGGWIDMISWDFFGPRMTRMGGENDTAYLARVVPELTRRRVTRAAIQQALVQLTGNPVRLIEPSQLADVGFWRMRGSGTTPVSFYRVDTMANPARWSSRGLRYQFFVECVLPLTKSFGNSAMPAWGKFSGAWFKRGGAGAKSGPSAWILRGAVTQTGGEQSVFNMIKAMRAAGITCWVKFVPLQTATQWDADGAIWDQPGVTWD